MNSSSFSASFIIISESIEWNLKSVFANKYCRIWGWPRNYEKWQIVPSWFLIRLVSVCLWEQVTVCSGPKILSNLTKKLLIGGNIWEIFGKHFRPYPIPSLITLHPSDWLQNTYNQTLSLVFLARDSDLQHWDRRIDPLRRHLGMLRIIVRFTRHNFSKIIDTSWAVTKS